MVRRRVQLSLAAVLLLMTGIAVCCAYLAHIHQRRQAVQAIHELGGAVRTEAGLKSSVFLTLEHVIDAQFMGSPIGDDDITQLVAAVQSLPELEKLILVGTNISRDGFKRLELALPQVDIHFSNPIESDSDRAVPVR